MPGPWWRRAGFFLLSPARGREELEQRQRLLERRVRRVKRWVQGMKTAMDGAAADDIRAELEDKYRKLALRLQEKNQAYREFCRQNDLKPYQERLAIARWDRKQAAAATAAARKAERAAAATPKKVEPEDVTEEYLQTATHGQGEITYDDGYEKDKNSGDIKMRLYHPHQYGRRGAS